MSAYTQSDSTGGNAAPKSDLAVYDCLTGIEVYSLHTHRLHRRNTVSYYKFPPDFSTVNFEHIFYFIVFLFTLFSCCFRVVD